MTASTTTGGAPLVVGLGGTLRANSSTERALRYCLDSVERQGGRTKFFAGRDLDLPMYAPHELERTPKALELVSALRDADAVVVGSPGYHGAVSGLVKNALDYIEDLREDPRVYLDNTPWGCISCAYGWQAAVGTLGQLRSIGHALRAWPTPLGVAINSADEIWDAAGQLADTGGAEPARHARHPGAHLRPRRLGNGVTEVARKTVLVDGLVTGYLEAGQGDPVVLLHGGEFGVSAESGLGAQHRRAGGALPRARTRHAWVRRLREGHRLQRRPRHADQAHRAVLRCGRGRISALRRQLDGRGQPVRRRHIGIPGVACAQPGDDLRRWRDPAKRAFGRAL